MTKQEVKEEHKETEGSPEPRAQQRQRQREILEGRLRKAVATAHVVLTNPTHFAVALRYDQGKDQVPVVVAKGRGQTALAIRELAGEFEVPILEYPQPRPRGLLHQPRRAGGPRRPLPRDRDGPGLRLRGQSRAPAASSRRSPCPAAPCSTKTARKSELPA
jgi:hypothetical protein